MSNKRLESAEDFLFWKRAYKPVNLPAIFKHEKRRDAAHAESRGGLFVVVNVELCDFHSTGKIGGKLFYDGRNHSTRAAPRSPHIYQHGQRRQLDLRSKT